MTSPLASPLATLSQVFGYTSFRPGQEELIQALLSGRDVLGIMPTGGGKSICYQVPALMLSGVTLVVSPLISLMQDQVRALVGLGVRGAYLNSSLSPRQLAKALDNACQGMYKIIYVAPERLDTEGIRRLVRSVDISMVCVDEAHCVSQWGQDFRPSYLDIPRFVRSLPHRPRVAAFTATATPRVRKDITTLLELDDPAVTVTGFDRPNLYFQVLQPADKKSALLRCVKERRERSGIVYCLTRKEVEMVCDWLNTAGIPATRYHAGLEAEERRQNQEDFLYDRKQVMVATNAFGMGIDKSNVSFVIHYNMPGNLESYYQEAGRAGRDGSPADCILLYSKRDVKMNEFLIEHGDRDPALDAKTARFLREQDLDRLGQMEQYATTRSCLRKKLLSYFGEKPAARCENCSVCQGKPRDFIPQVVLHLPGWKSAFAKSAAGRASQVYAPRDRKLLSALQEERARLARKEGSPPFSILADISLRQMAMERPSTPAQLMNISGMTTFKCQRYGEAFLTVIAQFEEESR